MHRLRTICAFLLLLSFLFIAASHPPFLTDDFKDPFGDESPEPNDFGETDPISDDNADPGSWLPILEPSSSPLLPNPTDPRESLYFSGLQTLISAASSGDPSATTAAAADISSAAASGHPHAQSALAFLHSTGTALQQSSAKAFLYHKFAADAGDSHSKMALAYSYFRQEMYEEAVELYAELAEMAVASFTTNKQAVVQPIRIHRGMEEDKEALRKMLGEDEEDFQVMKFQAQRGNVEQMFHIGQFYYYGFNGLRVDYAKAFFWFSKAAAKGEVSSVEYMGEMYARGAGVERNYTKALGALAYVSMQQEFPSYNGLGYLFAKGYGVKQNYTKAREYFEKASENNEPGGHYNLGVLHLKGMGVKRDITAALKLFHIAAETHQPKALYQLAKLHQKGIVLEKNLQKATVLYKKVAERGPWNLLLRWALESYLKGDIGKALLLYSRMAEMGIEVAQSNEAWILDKYGDHSMCMGESGVCTDTERRRRAHSLWWQASKQGNEHAALLIGDAHYYGRGIERDYERAAEAYMHAKSQSNAQAMFNLGYMHEHGQGVPLDLHLAKRYYDQALEKEPAAKFAVVLALLSLWIRKNYTNSYLVELIDSLPHICTRIKTWVDVVLMDEGNVMILSLFICLLTVLYLRDRRRRQASGQ